MLTDGLKLMDTDGPVQDAIVSSALGGDNDVCRPVFIQYRFSDTCKYYERRGVLAEAYAVTPALMQGLVEDSQPDWIIKALSLPSSEEGSIVMRTGIAYLTLPATRAPLYIGSWLVKFNDVIALYSDFSFKVDLVEVEPSHA